MESPARRVIDIVRQLEAFVAPVGIDVGGLAVQIDGIFRIDLELVGDLGSIAASSGQMPRDVGHADRRIGQ